MLIVSRKANEVITIEPAHPLDSTALSKVFEHGAIEIKLVQIGGSRVRIAIHAPPELKIWRGPRTAAEHAPERDAPGVRDAETMVAEAHDE
jgi:sRNA-binding carbon storage regulator CsrA